MYIAEVMKKFAPLNGADIPVADNINELAEELISNNNVIALQEEGKGVILGILYPHFLNPSMIVAQEIGWWVEPEYRNTSLAIRLLKKFEAEAADRGASKVIMISLESQEPAKVGSIYQRMGYRLIEHNYIKEI